MKHKTLSLVISTIIGVILGYFFAAIYFNGWFDTSWKKVDPPPVKVSKIVAIDSFSLWIESDTGLLYYNADTQNCRHNCWEKVPIVPVLTTVNQEETVTNTACSPAPPLRGMKLQIAQCRKVELNWGFHQNFIYALRNDVNIYRWYTSGYVGEGFFFNYLLLSCIGGFIFFIPTLFLALYFSMIDTIKARAEKANETL